MFYISGAFSIHINLQKNSWEVNLKEMCREITFHEMTRIIPPVEEIVLFH